MKITIPHKINEQIQFYVDKSDVECSGLGKVIVTPQGYTVTEVCLLKQENTGTHTEIDASAVTKAMFDLRASEGGIYFWWHSHVNMGVFWSSTDVATIEEIGQNGLCVAVVFNKKKERKGAVWLKGSELSPDLYFNDIPVELMTEQASEATKAQWAADFDAKCKTKEYVSAVSDFKYGANFPAYHRNDSFDLNAFEKSLDADSKQKIAYLGETLVNSFIESEVDKALAEILETIKGSKANKHDKKKAYREYKEMALDQKNYLADVEQRMGGVYGAQ